jgi:membrane-associated phospholipid phosphatase
LRRALTFGLALVLAAPAAARAQERPEVRFRVGVWPDGAVVAGGFAAAVVPLVWPGSFAHATCAPCNPAPLWSIDRSTVGPIRSAASLASYGTIGVEAALGAFFLARSRQGQGTAAFVEDATVIAEAVSLTTAATTWTKVLVHRPRPYRYLTDATGTPTADDGRSFPSNHASVAFAAAAAFASILHRRGIAGRHKVEIGLLFAAAAATGVLRVAAHEHFPTDVLAGATLGFTIGWTIPALHAIRR